MQANFMIKLSLVISNHILGMLNKPRNNGKKKIASDNKNTQQEIVSLKMS